MLAWFYSTSLYHVERHWFKGVLSLPLGGHSASSIRSSDRAVAHQSYAWRGHSQSKRFVFVRIDPRNRPRFTPWFEVFVLRLFLSQFLWTVISSKQTLYQLVPLSSTAGVATFCSTEPSQVAQTNISGASFTSSEWLIYFWNPLAPKFPQVATSSQCNFYFFLPRPFVFRPRIVITRRRQPSRPHPHIYIYILSSIVHTERWPKSRPCDFSY